MISPSSVHLSVDVYVCLYVFFSFLDFVMVVAVGVGVVVVVVVVVVIADVVVVAHKRPPYPKLDPVGVLWLQDARRSAGAAAHGGGTCRFHPVRTRCRGTATDGRARGSG
jgi:hypothetical protein